MVIIEVTIGSIERQTSENERDEGMAFFRWLGQRALLSRRSCDRTRLAAAIGIEYLNLSSRRRLTRTVFPGFRTARPGIESTFDAILDGCAVRRKEALDNAAAWQLLPEPDPDVPGLRYSVRNRGYSRILQDHSEGTRRAGEHRADYGLLTAGALVPIAQVPVVNIAFERYFRGACREPSRADRRQEHKGGHREV